MTPFKFALRNTVVIQASGEHAEVIGRAEYLNAVPGYLLRYRRGDGTAVEQWWPEDALIFA
jgi:hypothetical protein